MIAALDVHYDEVTSRGRAAAVVFHYWSDSDPCSEYNVVCSQVQEYVPGKFFQRELPCLLAVLAEVQERLTVILVDGYVSLGEKPGLGLHLWKALGERTPVIGVAKSRYKTASSVEILRGQSRTPLFVTAMGIDPVTAAENIRSMSGAFRIPRMLRRVDQLGQLPLRAAAWHVLQLNASPASLNLLGRAILDKSLHEDVRASFLATIGSRGNQEHAPETCSSWPCSVWGPRKVSTWCRGWRTSWPTGALSRRVVSRRPGRLPVQVSPRHFRRCSQRRRRRIRPCNTWHSKPCCCWPSACRRHRPSRSCSPRCSRCPMKPPCCVPCAI